MNKHLIPQLAAFSALALGACADVAPHGGPDAADVHVDPTADVDDLTEDLALGSNGPAVRVVQEYLATYGYLPNARLAKRYPSWRPLVKQDIAELGRFDSVTQRAVLALQRQSGLPETGIVDAETRELIGRKRCGIPEGIGDGGPDNHFAPAPYSWPKRNLTWRMVNADTFEVTLERGRVLAAAAASTWAAETSITFTQVTSGEDIPISFDLLDADDGVAPNTLAYTSVEFETGSKNIVDVAMVLDTEQVWWSADAAAPASTADVQTVILHELGHALGLKHSSIPGSIMLPAPARTQRFLAMDDRIAISTLYDDWIVVPGQARDLAAGGTVGGAIWAIGTNSVPGGSSPLRWNGQGWDTAPGGAVRIAVDSLGVPWVVNSVGKIFRRTSGSAFSGTWELIAGCAKDIGAGGGAVWIIGCTATPGGFTISKFNGTGWNRVAGGATRISVGPSGVPWLVNSAGTVFRRSTSSDSSGSWAVISEAGHSGLASASDIAVSHEDGTAWIVGFAGGNSSGLPLFVWNEQNGTGAAGDPSGAPARRHWIALPGILGTSIIGGTRPWVTNSLGTVLRTRR